MTKYQKWHTELIREVAVAKILRGKGLYDSAIYYAEKCFKKGKEMARYDIAEESGLILLRYYGTRLRDNKKYQYYKRELARIAEIRSLERFADECYSEMMIFNTKKKHKTEEYLELCISFLDRLSPSLDDCDSFHYQLRARLIQANVDSISCDFHSMYQHCCEAVDYYLDRKVLHTTSLAIFLNQKTTACIRLGHYEEGIITINQAYKIVPSDNLNWFPIKHNEFFIYMQSGQYEAAHRVYQEVFRNKKFKKINPYWREGWAVAEAYLHYVIEAGILETDKPAKYRVGRFINTVPEYSKDKRVQNIPILIIQILFMLLRHRTDEAIDRIEAIEKYCARHLRYNEAVRSNAFIMMLLQIPKASFSKLGVERRIQKYTNKLQEVKIHQSGKAFDLELIPYETLWNYALTCLK